MWGKKDATALSLEWEVRMDRERKPGEENKTRFEQLIEKARDQHSKGAYEEALENVSRAIELAPDEPRVVKNIDIFVNALVERASVYKDLGLYAEAFADLEAAEDIVGGTDQRLDHAREAIKKEREEIQKETILKEKMRRAAGHAPTSEGLFASILHPFRNTSTRARETSRAASPQESAPTGTNPVEANLRETSPQQARRKSQRKELISVAPTWEEPISQKSTSSRPISKKPISKEPISKDSTLEKPTVGMPTWEEPISKVRISEEPVSQEPPLKAPTSRVRISKERFSKKPMSKERTSETPKDLLYNSFDLRMAARKPNHRTTSLVQDHGLAEKLA
jgi:hypothetical protein